MASGWIFDVKRFAVHDGPGIRTTLFFKGCPLRCSWCHNPESQDTGVATLVREKKLEGRIFREEEVIGKHYTVEEVMDELTRDIVFYHESSGGVTFSGGEPLMQPAFLSAALEACKRAGIHTCVDTCGYAGREDLERIAECADLILYDLKLMEEEEHARYTGVSNSLILDNLEWLGQRENEVVIRMPLIPGVTDRVENLEMISNFLGKTRFRRIDVMPFHHMARGKYRKLRLPYFETGETGVPVEEIARYFSQKGFITKIF